MDFYLMNEDFQIIDVVEGYESLIWTERYNLEGDFDISFPIGLKNLGLYQSDCYILTADSESIMIIDTNESETNEEEGDFFHITGKSLESILRRRIAWGQRTLYGNFQERIHYLLNVEMIQSTDTRRNIPLTFKYSTDPYITGLTIDTQVTGDSLYDVITGFCGLYNVGFKITMPELDGNLIFEMYSGADRSYSQTDNPHVVFSPQFENLLSSDFVNSKRDLMTITLVAGEGEGSARRYSSISSVEDGLSGLKRRELFTDARDISSTVDGQQLTNTQYINLLQTRGLEKLNEHTEIFVMDGKVDYNGNYKYGRDYFLGDVVQLLNELGYSLSTRVIEYIRSISVNGESSYPTFDVVL